MTQAVNFFILLVILKKFAYQPILEMLRKRREDIERGIKASKEAEERLKKADVFKEEILDRARQDSLQIVSRAEDAAKIRKEEIVKEAGRKGEGIIAAAKRSAREEKAKMNEEVYKEARELIRLGLEQTLQRMPSRERDEKLIENALEELKMAKG